MKHLIIGLTAFIICFSTKANNTFIKWEQLSNPVFYVEDWSVKDASVHYNNKTKTFHLFFSAFYEDRGRERSHVVSVTTKDWINYSEPKFIWSGADSGWYGACSPEIHKINEKFILTYNRWGDKEGLLNQLFYAVSDDLINWEKHMPLAHNLTSEFRAIDAALAYHNKKYFLYFKESKPLGNDDRVDLTRLAYSQDLDNGWEYVYSGYPFFQPKNASYSPHTHENYRLIKIDNTWHMQTTDYFPHNPYLYKIGGDPNNIGNWLVWEKGYKLNLPLENFNTEHRANAGHLVDWREHDGYFYLIYAGNTEKQTHWGRGNNKLGLARSKDLINWEVP